MKLRIHQIQMSQKQWQRWLLYAAVSIVALTLVGLIIAKVWYSQSLKPREVNTTEKRVFVVSPGQVAYDIGVGLEKAELIKSSTAFMWYVDREEVRHTLQAGTYRFSPSMSTPEIVNDIASGRIDAQTVTIVPGLRLDQVKEVLGQHFSSAQINAALKRQYNHPLLKSKPKNASLEGYIYPDTYHIDETMRAGTFIERTFDTLYDRITPAMKRSFKSERLTLHEAITLASIIQMESSSAEEQRTIAQVFLSRLEEGMPLGSDPTFIYAARIQGVSPSVDIDSPYNTRINKGLPPGPIATFNLSALEALANPTDTTYLYFVAGDDGVTRFSKSLQEHEALKEKYCKKNCLLPQ